MGEIILGDVSVKAELEMVARLAVDDDDDEEDDAAVDDDDDADVVGEIVGTFSIVVANVVTTGA